MKRNNIKMLIDLFTNLGVVCLGIMYLISAVMLILMMLFEGRLENKTFFYIVVYFSVSALLIRFKSFFSIPLKIVFHCSNDNNAFRNFSGRKSGWRWKAYECHTVPSVCAFCAFIIAGFDFLCFGKHLVYKN